MSVYQIWSYPRSSLSRASSTSSPTGYSAFRRTPNANAIRSGPFQSGGRRITGVTAATCSHVTSHPRRGSPPAPPAIAPTKREGREGFPHELPHHDDTRRIEDGSAALPESLHGAANHADERFTRTILDRVPCCGGGERGGGRGDRSRGTARRPRHGGDERAPGSRQRPRARNRRRPVLLHMVVRVLHRPARRADVRPQDRPRRARRVSSGGSLEQSAGIRDGVDVFRG